jgi:hypothetical protein
MTRARARLTLPKPSDRLPIGHTGLAVSPFCIGITSSAETIIEAFEEGINFFFVSADLHWPLYQQTRQGLAKLLSENHGRRGDMVIAVVSYLDEPLFGHLQFHQVIESVPGLRYIDVLIAGAVSNENHFYRRLTSLNRGRTACHLGARAIGASFHSRSSALLANNSNLLDISYIRYNTSHPGARLDLLPYLRADRSGLIFNFTSMMFRVTESQFAALRLPSGSWLPKACDYYRFVLTHPAVDGILCSPEYPDEVQTLVRALDLGPLSLYEEEYMIRLSSIVRSTQA